MIFVKGFLSGASLIIAIGAQNAYVLSHGIRKQNTILIPFICSLIDSVLIILGVTGMGYLVKQVPSLLTAVQWGGAAFLFVYGLLSLKSAFSGSSLRAEEFHKDSRLKVILQVLAISLLNPHVYLDTVFLLGSLSSAYGGSGKYIFAAGAVCASWSWFFLLSLTGRGLSSVFQNTLFWKILDIIIWIVMWWIAWNLLF